MAAVCNHQLNYTSLVTPGVVPPLLGSFQFDTLNTVSFVLAPPIPNTAQQINVTVTISCGCAKDTSPFTVWLWTELENGRQDVKFKQGMRYPQNAFSTDSETFSFAYSSNYPRLFLKSDYNKNSDNMWMSLFVVGYAQ